jgi:hypothetical protein
MNHIAIYALYPNAKIIHDDLGVFDNNGNRIEIDLALVNAWVDPETYKYQRAAEYPSFAEQFDTLYHGGYDAWKATIDSVKAKYPKP